MKDVVIMSVVYNLQQLLTVNCIIYTTNKYLLLDTQKILYIKKKGFYSFYEVVTELSIDDTTENRNDA